MAYAGEGYNFHVTALTHDEHGYPNMTPPVQDKLVRRLQSKIHNAAGWLTQRPDHIENVIARLQRIRQAGRFPSRLHHNTDGAARQIVIFDGHRNPFAFLINAQNHKLAGFLSAGNGGSFQNEPLDAGGNELCVDNFEHERSVDESQFDCEGSATERQ
jgi:hypothetical protein